METVKISKKLMKRLLLYLAHLKTLPENSHVSATSMARVLGLGDVQVRKDLAKVSERGRRRTGRSREQLIRDIEQYLDFATETGTVIVGAGKLGRALLDYGGFEESGLNMMAGFDRQPCPETSETGKPIYPMHRLESFCRHYDVHIGIITVPAESAQSVSITSSIPHSKAAQILASTSVVTCPPFPILVIVAGLIPAMETKSFFFISLSIKSFQSFL